MRAVEGGKILTPLLGGRERGYFMGKIIKSPFQAEGGLNQDFFLYKIKVVWHPPKMEDCMRSDLTSEVI